MARFPAFLDTCSIFPAYLCDTLLRLAEAGTFRPLWSAGVLEELQSNLVEQRGLPSEIDDFPAKSTESHDITVVHPGDFLLDQLDLYPGITVAALRDQAGSYSSPSMTIEELLGRLAAAGVPRFASEARRHL